MDIVCHLSTVHSCGDTRIAHHECMSLARAGYKVVLIAIWESVTAPDFKSINYIPLKQQQGRFSRFLRGYVQAFPKVLKSGANVVHFHDPELIPMAILLRLLGKKIIYDVHEDVTAAILDKRWIHPMLRRIVAAVFSIVEKIGVTMSNAVITATPTIANKFPAHKTTCVKNMPQISELSVPVKTDYHKRPFAVCYLGVITPLRGVYETIDAMQYFPDESEAQLHLIGQFKPIEQEDQARQSKGWKRVVHHGFQTRNSVGKMLGEMRAGVVVFQPCANHINAQPNKIFEYMSAGLPLIASDFPMWRELIEGTGCGLLVNPSKPMEIYKAMQWVFDHPDEAGEMGKRGRLAVETQYSWEVQEQVLLSAYQSINVKPRNQNIV